MLTTLVGMPVSALAAAALLVDIETMDRNIAHIAGKMRRHGVQWRPHAKGYKCPAITHRQMAAERMTQNVDTDVLHLRTERRALHTRLHHLSRQRLTAVLTEYFAASQVAMLSERPD